MVRILLFLGALAGSLYIILYTESYKLSLIIGSSKVVMNLWFAMIIFLLGHLTLYWLMNRLSKVMKIRQYIKGYRARRLAHDRQHARGQAVIYALAGQYNAALTHLTDDEQLADMVLKATWLNQIQDIARLDIVLSRIQASNGVADGWLIWFRAYLLNARGKKDLASDILLDALDSGVKHEMIAKSYVAYLDPLKHYAGLTQHYRILSRYVDEAILVDLMREGLCDQMDKMIEKGEWEKLSECLSSLPRKIRKDSALAFYAIKELMASMDDTQALHVLAQSDFKDQRLVPLVVELNVSMEQKIALVKQLIERFPHNRDLIYLSSYLHAQDGAVDDSVKMLENVWGKVNQVG